MRRRLLLPLLTILLFSLFYVESVSGQCMAEAGTITVNDDGGGTVPFVVCFGESVDVTTDNNFVLPPTGPAPDMVYLFYSCAPTGPDPALDPCWTGWFWTGSNFQPTNDGNISGNPAIGNTFIIVPTVIDNNQPNPNGPGIDADGDGCWDINPNDTETFTFLNEIVITEISVDDCAGEVILEITGGYPELFPPAMYMVSNPGPGSFTQSGPDGGIITITGLMDGDNYGISLDDDGNGCSLNFVNGPIDQNLQNPVLSYDPICEGGSGFPSIAAPSGGMFEFVTPPGDGATIDPVTGEVSNVMGDYDIRYIDNSGCAPTSTTFLLMMSPPPPPPSINTFYEFCESDNTVIFPGGIGDFFTLYDGEFSTPELDQGQNFDFLDYLNPGDPETFFWMSQTVDGCESERIEFSVIIYGDDRPFIDPIITVCEGEPVTLEPLSGNGNFTATFNFYGNSSLTDLLFTGETYTFTPTGSTTIYITEQNVVCESAQESVDIIVEPPPTGTVAEPMCYAGNALYSVVVTTNAQSVTSSSGFVVDNNDGTFTVFDVASGDFLDITLFGSIPGCETLIELLEYDCGCIPPNPPTSNGDVTICAGDPIPALSVNVGGGQTADWYDAATGGTLLLSGNTSFTPPGAGTYYAETRVIADDCLSLTRIAVTLTIDPTPSLVSSMVACAPNLLTYTVTLQLNNTASLTTNTGTVTNNGGGNFTVSNIAVGTNLTYTAVGTNASCTFGPTTITAPTCPCPAVNAPTANQNISICPGDPIPTLSVMVDPGLTADWYDQASGGTLLAGGTLTYTPPATGTFFVEARDPVNNCVSSRITITLSTSPAPGFTLVSATCAANLLTYDVQLNLTNADQLMTNGGTITNNGGGSFSVTGITAGMDLQITITSSTTTCSLMDVITAPDCSCAIVTAPVSNGDITICSGDPIPALSVMVGAGETVDWYDAPTGGTLLLGGNTSYTPTAAGTYYAETRVLADGCVSSTRTAVTLTIDPTPSLVSSMANCAPDLLSYSVSLQLNNTATLNVNTGNVTNNGGGSFTVDNIAVGTDLIYTAFGTNVTCTFGPETVISPACPCPAINAPVTNQNISLCPGDPIPTLTVTVDAGLTADWYDAPNAGTLLMGSSLTYTPPGAGTYYVEARDPVNNCLSTRIAIVVTVNPAPTYNVLDVSCAIDLLTYEVQISISNADQLMTNGGTITNNGGGNYTVSGITAGMDLQITLSSSTNSCTLMDVITSPDCNCAAIIAPASNGDASICSGNPIPSLSVTVGAGETVDWYDAPSGGTLLLANSNSYTPTMAGTYYAETRVLADGCVSSVRTAVTLTINPMPAFVSSDTICAADLLTYTVTLSITDATSLDVNAGMVNDMGGGNFTISGIPAGTPLNYTAFNSNMTCSLGPNTIDPPVCPCPTIADPTPAMVSSICPGDPIPTLSVMVDPGLTADWYDDPVAGSLLAASTLTFTPASDGTYYVEARDPVNNCTSNRVAITIVTNPTPSFMVVDAVCAMDLMSYQVDITVADADMVMVNAGNVTDNGGGSYTINNIPAGVDLIINLDNTVTGCSFSDTVTALDCSCGTVNPPISDGDVSVCAGDPIPDLSVTVGAGETADWYDAPTGGTQLATNTTTFAATVAGTYYAETRVVADDCISFSRTAVVLTINLNPSIDGIMAECAPNLLTYTVMITTTDAASIQADQGMVINNGAGAFSIIDVPAGTDVAFTAFNDNMTCSAGPEMVTAPDCSCPVVNPPISGGDVAVCAGTPLPNLSVSVGTDETADWYDMPVGGTLLLGASLSFTPPGAGTYYAETRNTIHNCTSQRIAITATINPLPSFVLQDTICSPDLLTYQVDIQVMDADEVVPSLGTLVDNGGGSYSITDIPSGVDLNFTLNNTLTSCSSNATVMAPDCSCDVIAAPVSDGDATICSGEQIPALTVTVAAGQTVDWYDAPTGGTLLLDNSTSYTPTAAGTYYAETREGITNCLSDVRTAVVLTINPTPVLVINGANCAPDLLTYSVSVSTTDATSISTDVGMITDDGGGNFTVSGIPAAMDVRITAFNSDMSCSVGPEMVTAPDCSCPTIDPPVSGGDVSICVGEDLPDLTVSVGPDETADWYDAPMGGNLLLGDSESYSPSGEGLYYVESRNTINNCVSERIAIMLTINPLPDQTELGTGCSPDLLSWQYAFNVTEGSDVVNSTIGTISEINDTTYMVTDIPAGSDMKFTITNFATGCSSTFTIPAPDCSCDPVVAPVSDGDLAICAGEEIPALSVNVADGQTVNWYSAAMGGSLLLADNTSFQPTAAGTYFAETQVIVNNCVSDIRTPVTLTIFDNPELSLTSTMEPGCTNDDGSITVNGSGGEMPYEYRIEGGEWQTENTFGGLGVGDYLIEIQDANGCMGSMMQNLNSPTAVIATFSVGGMITCAVNSVALDASGSSTGNDITYSWIDPDGVTLPSTGITATATQAGNHELIVTNTLTNCVNTVTVAVLADMQAPQVEAGEDGLITCDFATADLLATSITPGNLSYSWSASNGGVLTGNVNQQNVTAMAGGLYTVVVTNSDNGCTQTDSLVVNEIINTEIALNITSQDPDCLGDENGSIILAAADPNSMLLFARDSGAFSANNVFTNLAAGSYNFQVQDEYGCEVSTTVIINEGTEITLDLGDDHFISLGDSVHFDPIILGVNPSNLTSIKWSNSQWLNCDDCLDATTIGSMASTNLFQLQVVDSLGCSASDEVQVFVNKERHIYMPTAFSPDDDGVNDILYVNGGPDVALVESFTVFNRWGEVVFEKLGFLPNDPLCGWDGTGRGQQSLNSAVFVYMLEVRFVDGEVEVFSGDVVLLR